MNRNADGDFLTPGQPLVVIAVTFMCVLLALALFGLKNSPEIQKNSEREFLLHDIIGLST